MSGRGHRTRDNARMAEIIEAEYSDDHNSKLLRPTQKRRSKGKRSKKGDISDPGDANFSASSRGEGESSDGSGNDSDVMVITNEEVCTGYFTILWYTDSDWIYICSSQTPCLRKLSHPSAASPQQKQRASSHNEPRSVYGTQLPKALIMMPRCLSLKNRRMTSRPYKKRYSFLKMHSMYSTFSRQLRRASNAIRYIFFLKKMLLMQTGKWAE